MRSPRWHRSSPTSPPGPARSSARRSTRVIRVPAELGWLHCGPNGAGHFVKMVHNGIEYGMMAALAEGLNILSEANVGAADRPKDAETAPLTHPEYYQYDFDLGRDHRAVATRQRHLELAARPGGRSPRRGPGARRLRGVRQRQRRRPLDDSRGDRRRCPGAGAQCGAVRPLRLARQGHARPTRSCRRCAPSSAATWKERGTTE